ncbi:MAG: SpaA isopeptide-forming pilin-related protein [Lachnospiraceae bacterium]|jgi:predicted RNA-binding protein with TRAM domain
MKKRWKRLLIFLCIAALSVTIAPITASAASHNLILGKDTGNTLFGARKTLDLQSAGASVQFTDADRDANTAEAAQEYDDIISETVALFEPVYNDMAEYIQTAYGIDLTDDSGSIAENWPEILADANLNKTADKIISEVWNSISDNDDVSTLNATADAYFDESTSRLDGDASGIPGSRMEKYLRYRYFIYLYPSESSDPRIGSVDWYQRYSNLKSLKGNDSCYERTNFIKKRAVQLNSDTINERLQSVLSNAEFDFYLESFDSSEESDNGIGEEVSLDSQNLTVYNGGFNDSSASSVYLTSVDFSNENQFYDSDLWDALPSFGDTLSDDILYDDLVDGLSLIDHFFLFDGGSIESSIDPYLYMSGAITYSSTTVWPYESASKPFADGEWNYESLADYSIFGNNLYRSTDELFSFYDNMALTGINSLSSTGYDIYIPNFDDSGNIVSVSKPLFYELDDPTSSYEKHFDRDTLVSSLSLDQNGDGTNDAGVYRYKMVEETNDATVNGKPIAASGDYQIFDVVVDENGAIHFFVYDDTDDMTDAYSQENVAYENELGAIGYGFTVNNYAAGGSVTLEAEKTIDGEVPDSSQTFEFELIDEDGNVVSTAVNEQGSVTFDPITLDANDMGKTYEFTMTEVGDSGSGDSYTYDDSIYTVEVTVGDSVDENGTITGTAVVYKDSDGNVIDGLPVFENETRTDTVPTGSITIHKTLDTYDADKSIFDQQDLTLYGFTLYAKNDIVSAADGSTVLYKAGAAVSAEISCDEDGNARISGILPGEYILKETKMPSGTAAATSEPEIVVAADEEGSSAVVYVNGQKQSSSDVINFENYVSKIEIEKKNESGEYVKGATLQLTDSDTGEVLDTWVTGTAAHKIAGLEFGHTYTLRETDAPDGYQKAKDISFVPEGTYVQIIVMTDSRTQTTAEDKDTENNGNVTTTAAAENNGSGTMTANTGTNGDSTVSNSDSTSVDSSDNAETVQTGDNSMLPVTAAVMVAALAALAIVFAERKFKNE